MLGEGGAEAPSIAQSLPDSECPRAESEHAPATSLPAPSGQSLPPSGGRRRTKANRARVAPLPSPLQPSSTAITTSSPSASSSPICHAPSSSSAGLVGVSGALPSPAHRPRGSAPVSPGSWSDCSGGSSGGLERCGMDESWFVTPPPCFTAEGATAEASPMEDLLIEHPSMSVYVSPGNLSMVEESAASLAGSVR